ncbi:MAG: peptidylprolyl isomerase [Desulfuromonas sp.]|nr:MAG: peptidylprolyl isomerase [Desulfuromonas sp.]
MSNPTVTLETSHGSIVLELDADKAPKTVANFLSYARDGFFDGTIFHRVISNFMIQGGGFTPDMEQKKAKRPIRNEADNGLKNQRGTVAMARTNDPHSASSQFFINVVDNDFLDHVAKTPMGYGYCVFGQVVEGMDAVDAIRQVATGDSGHHQDVPKEAVVIESATVQE